jgi:phosphoglycolate phosphatase-like HAD superfamily hydrolase
MVRLVLFDIDGTLIRTRGAGVKAFERTLASEFHVHNGTAHVKFAGRVDPSIVRECFMHHAIAATPENFRRFFDSYVFWLDFLLGEFKGTACAGVWTLIRDLQSLPHPPRLGLLTGNIRLGAEIKLRHFGLWDFFVTGAFGDDHESRRQLAVIARARGGQLIGDKLRGEEILVVGDTPHDIDCARAIEARTLAVGTGGAGLAELKAHHPTWLVEDLTRVTAEALCA